MICNTLSVNFRSILANIAGLDAEMLTLNIWVVLIFFESEGSNFPFQNGLEMKCKCMLGAIFSKYLLNVIKSGV